jgi:hypothetical protein
MNSREEQKVVTEKSLFEQKMLTHRTFSCTNDNTKICAMQSKFDNSRILFIQFSTYDLIVLNIVFKLISFSINIASF